MFLPQLVAATFALAAPSPSDSVALFLSDASVGRAAPAECVKAAVSRLRGQLASAKGVRLVGKHDEASLVVDVRECGSRWETKASGEFGVGVGVTRGGGPVSNSSGTQGVVGVHRRQYGYVILRASSADRAREFSSLHRTDLFDEAVSVAADQLLDWVDEHAGEVRPR